MCIRKFLENRANTETFMTTSKHVARTTGSLLRHSIVD